MPLSAQQHELIETLESIQESTTGISNKPSMPLVSSNAINVHGRASGRQHKIMASMSSLWIEALDEAIRHANGHGTSLLPPPETLTAADC